MISILDKKQCSGCSACFSVCPKGAIMMQSDAMGFLYPVVNAGLCTDCGLCEKVCGFNNNIIESRVDLPIPYAVRHLDTEEVKSSRSGAAFVALSDEIISRGGVVYGAAYDEGFKIVHKRASNRQERDEFKGSKYSQSDLGDIFKCIRRDLKENMFVLFSGTPCQVSGLIASTPEILRSKLYTIDIVCHGVPSPAIWKDYISFIERRYKSRITSANFRDKGKGWASHYESFKLANGKKITRYSYACLFYKNLINRDSCSVCPFADKRRVGDITLADFWGIDKISDINKDNLGVSLCLISTIKGKELFSNIEKQVWTKEIENFEYCIQPNMLHPTFESSQKQKFIRDYENLGFAYVMKRYGDSNFRVKLGRIKHNIQLFFKGKKKFIDIFDVIYL